MLSKQKENSGIKYKSERKNILKNVKYSQILSKKSNYWNKMMGNSDKKNKIQAK